MLFRLLQSKHCVGSPILKHFYSKMTSKSALVLLADGNEEMEVVITVDVLRRAGMDVTLAGLKGVEAVECSRKVKLVPDSSLKDAISKGAYDIVILPGGLGGSKAFCESQEVGSLLKDQRKAGRSIGAICAAPLALKAHKIDLGKKLTSYPAMKKDLIEDNAYIYLEDRVVIDGDLITSRGPGTAFEFAAAIVEHLLGQEAADKVTAPLLLR